MASKMVGGLTTTDVANDKDEEAAPKAKGAHAELQANRKSATAKYNTVIAKVSFNNTVITKVSSKISSKSSSKCPLKVDALLDHITNSLKLSTIQKTEAINIATMEAAQYNLRHQVPDTSNDAAIARALAGDGHKTRAMAKLKREFEKHATSPADQKDSNEEASPDTDVTNLKIVQLRDNESYSFEEIAEMLNGAEILTPNLGVHTETTGLDSNTTNVTGNSENDNTGNVLPMTSDPTPMTGLVTDTSESTPTTSTWTANECYTRYTRAKESARVAKEVEANGQAELERQARLKQRKANGAKRRATSTAKATAKRSATSAFGDEDEQVAEGSDGSAEVAAVIVGIDEPTAMGMGRRITVHPPWDDDAEDALVIAVEQVRRNHWFHVAVRLRDLTGKTYLPSECERRYMNSETFQAKYLEALSRPLE